MKATILLFGATAMIASLSGVAFGRADDVRLAQASPPAPSTTPPAAPAPPAASPAPAATPPAAATPAPTAPSTTPPAASPPAAATPSAPPAAQPATPPAKMTGLAAWNVLVGNTVAGKVDGKDYADYYLSDGTVKSMVESQIVSGKWALEGDKICFTYPGDPKECYAVEVMGEFATFTDATGVGIRGQILKGNAKNL